MTNATHANHTNQSNQSNVSGPTHPPGVPRYCRAQHCSAPYARYALAQCRRACGYHGLVSRADPLQFGETIAGRGCFQGPPTPAAQKVTESARACSCYSVSRYTGVDTGRTCWLDRFGFHSSLHCCI